LAALNVRNFLQLTSENAQQVARQPRVAFGQHFLEKDDNPQFGHCTLIF
jgi:hypothetical protein